MIIFLSLAVLLCTAVSSTRIYVDRNMFAYANKTLRYHFEVRGRNETLSEESVGIELYNPELDSFRPLDPSHQMGNATYKLKEHRDFQSIWGKVRVRNIDCSSAGRYRITYNNVTSEFSIHIKRCYANATDVPPVIEVARVVRGTFNRTSKMEFEVRHPRNEVQKDLVRITKLDPESGEFAEVDFNDIDVNINTQMKDCPFYAPRYGQEPHRRRRCRYLVSRIRVRNTPCHLAGTWRLNYLSYREIFKVKVKNCVP